MAKGQKASNGGARVEDIPNHSADDVAECYVEYTEFMGQIARIRQKVGSMLNRYEQMGVHTKAVRACYRLANMDDAPEYVKEMLKAAAILKIIPAALESDGQMTFLPGLKVAPPSPESQAKINRSEVFWDGWEAGLAGHLAEVCKFDPGTEDYVTWGKGWKDGHEEWAAKPKNANVEVAPTEKRGRGRPRKVTPPDATQLEKDEVAFRAKAGESLHDVEPVTGTIQ